jgi:UDP-N-acetylmuramoyl-L-alanyl-D-glutamate--2,6-diaminopimelate ligase
MRDRPPSSWGPRNRGLTLEQVARELGARAAELSFAPDLGALHITGVQQDSRKVEPGDLFVARRGQSADGIAFVADALARGARAVLVEESLATRLPEGTPAVHVKQLDATLPFIADAVYGHPAFALEVIGVTGTNGKTTTTHLIRDGLDGASGRAACALVGTLGQKLGAYEAPTLHTTPEPDELARNFRTLRGLGAEYVAMEVSSIALELGRTRAVRFRVAAFTNLTQDHLDFHGDMEAYGRAKARLFFEYAPAVSVLNVGDPFIATLASQVRTPLLTVDPRLPAARGSSSADLRVEGVWHTPRGYALAYATPSGLIELETRLIGAHNVENIAVALGVAQALDVDMATFASALARSNGVPGRLERCDDEHDDVTALVDYAHTPDALQRALAAVRDVVPTGARLICLFGCGGDRDKGKRGPMGLAAARGADLAIVTSDNPRTESPEAIAEPILRAIVEDGFPVSPDSTGRGYWVELDRARAIEAAIVHARPGDVILVAGKGHEDYQIIGTEKRPFDDRVQARAALKRRARS